MSTTDRRCTGYIRDARGTAEIAARGASGTTLKEIR
jgi:hypothetical protein